MSESSLLAAPSTISTNPTTTVTNDENHDVKIIKFWDVIAPSPSNTVKGVLMKGLFSTIGKKRRVSLEIHRIPLSDYDKEGDEPQNKNLRASPLRPTLTKNENVKEKNYIKKAFLRISKRTLKPYPTVRTKSSGLKAVSKDGHDENSRQVVDSDDVNNLVMSQNGDMVDDISIASSSVNTTDMLNADIIEFPGADAAVDNNNLGTIYESQADDANGETKDDNEEISFQRQSRTQGQLLTRRAKWITKYKISLADVDLIGVEKNKVVLDFTLIEQIRKFHFSSSDDADDFQQVFSQTKQRDDEVAAINLKRVSRGLNIDEFAMNEKVDFLIDIVGAEKVVVSDISSSDPFVVAKFDGQEIHRTKHIDNNLNPIWTLRQNSLFIFSVTPKQLFQEANGIVFTVYDYDLNGCDILGSASLSPRKLFLANEERIEMDLKPVTIGQKTYPKIAAKNHDLFIGKIAIRCRRATEYDRNFLDEYKKKNKAALLPMTQEPVNVSKPTLAKTMISSNMKYIKRDNGEKVKMYKLRPGPNPNRADVLWMTPGEIEDEVMKPSLKYKSLGYGNIAKIHIEILQCDNLPNLETIKVFGNKTDAFVQIVYEDCIGETNVIDDSNNPRWMPWTNRAFTLHTKYPSSMIYVGVHDFDSGLSSHDFVGRCAIDITNMKPDTEYVLDYALYNTAMKVEREKQGTIKVRMRLEIENPRAYLLASLNFPPPVYINCKEAKTLRCIRNTVHGELDLTKYSLQTSIMLFREILQNKRVIHYALDIMQNILFWRPTAKFNIRVVSPYGSHHDGEDNVNDGGWIKKYTVRKQLSLPINSITLFLTAILVVEKPHLFPSLSFLSLFFLLMSTKDFRNSYPQPWWRTNTFTELLMLLLDKKQAPESIKAFESANEAKERDEYWQNLIESREKKALKLRLEIDEENRALEKDLVEAKGDADDLSTKISNVNVDPFFMLKPYLYPVQQSLIQVCMMIRFFRNVLLWEESHYSFFISLAALSLSLIFLFLPWVFLFRWSARLLVWSLLGPWMRIFDPRTNAEEQNEDEIDNMNRLKRKMQRAETLAQARIQNENARKYRDFKMYFFGKFLTKVPIIRTDRFLDLPLPSSTATPIDKRQLSFGELAIEEALPVDIQVGQQLVGVMIPQVSETPKTVAPTGQATKNKGLLQIGALGRDVEDDNTVMAYSKIGIMAVIAAIISYLAVPLMVKFLPYS